MPGRAGGLGLASFNSKSLITLGSDQRLQTLKTLECDQHMPCDVYTQLHDPSPVRGTFGPTEPATKKPQVYLLPGTHSRAQLWLCEPSQDPWPLTPPRDL